MTRQDFCPAGTEEVFYKPWYGTSLYCVCSRLTWTYHSEGYCLRSDDNYRDCMELPALSPVMQAQFNGVRICGTRGGLPFMDVTRVGKDGKCPKGTTACSAKTSAENTVCYPPAEHATSCPITSIDVVSGSEALLRQQQNQTVINLTSQQGLVYSKTDDAMAPTTIRVENKPCMSSETVSSAPNTMALPNELQEGKSCPVEPNTKLTNDERYTRAQNWEMSEADIMKENGVYERLYR